MTDSVHPATALHGVYAILNLTADDPHGGEATVRGWLDAGIRVVQLRAKDLDPSARASALQRLASPVREAGAALIVNDDLELACAGVADVWGVHLGQEDLAALRATRSLDSDLERLRARGLHLGLSTHRPAQVREAARWAPTYIGYGPVFDTQTKLNPDPTTGLASLSDACANFDGPVVAIGGIDASTAGHARRAGAACVAAISALAGSSRAASHAAARRMIDGWNAHADDREN